MLTHGFARSVRRLVLLITASALIVTPQLIILPAQAAEDPGLVAKLNSVLSDSRAQRAKTGAVVLDAKTGELLYSRHGKRSVMPASNTKIVTAVAAMHALTPTFRFKTSVIRRADVVGRTLKGRLYLKGYGDPTTRQADFAKLAKQVKTAGITHVDGSLIVDSSCFDHQRYNPGWKTSYASEYYAAPISALTVSPNSDYDSGTMYREVRPPPLWPEGQDHHVSGRRREVRQDQQPHEDLVARQFNHVLRAPRVRVEQDHRPRPGARGPVDRQPVDHRRQARAVRGRGLPRRAGQAQDQSRRPDQDHDHTGRPADSGGQRYLDAAVGPPGARS